MTFITNRATFLKKDMANKIEKMSLEELVAGEKAATIVRRAHEDKMMMYRGIEYDSMSKKEMEDFSSLSQKLAQINAVRLRIINEMEARLLDIE